MGEYETERDEWLKNKAVKQECFDVCKECHDRGAFQSPVVMALVAAILRLGPLVEATDVDHTARQAALEKWYAAKGLVIKS